MRNIVSRLNFAGRHVDAVAVQNVKEYHITGPAIVVNAGVTDAWPAHEPRKPVPALSSTILADTYIEQADMLVVLSAGEETLAGDITGGAGWHRLGDVIGDGSGTGGRPFPPDTPLWKSPQDSIGRISFDPAHLLREKPAAENAIPFDVRVNLWFAPAGTDCFIHNLHDFIEVHTQVSGTGRMQKFREQDHSTLYEDIRMSPGYTTPDPFCVTTADGSYRYPWHQYRADTDCVWLAVEYHKAT